MYYGVPSTSVRGGRARTQPRAREGCAYCNEGWGVQASAPTLLPVRPHHEQAEDWSALARVRGWASCSGSRGGVGSAFSPLLPLSLHLGFFLSFSFFFFFSMNTHRVHLKATLPHFTGSFGSSLLRFPLHFKLEKK